MPFLVFAARGRPGEAEARLLVVHPVRWFRKKFDIRPGEGRVVGPAFAILLLIVGAHTVLETARDALLLSELPPRALGIVYLAVAALTLPSAAFAAALSDRLGAQRGLAWTLVVAAAITSVFFFVPPSNVSVVVLYVVSGLIGAHLVPQFWALAGRLLTVGEGRRLINPIALSGVLGGLFGSGLAALALYFVPVTALILVAAGIFLLAAGVLAISEHDERNAPSSGDSRLKAKNPFSALAEQPLLRRIALLVVLSTASVLVIDYAFKWMVASTIPSEELGGFFARYYAAVNGLSLLVQLFVGGAVVRRMGVALAVGVTPALLLFGSLAVLLTGGAAFSVYVLRALDGSLRHSIHRITTELVYFPVPAGPRKRAKPLIDSTFARLAQAVTAAALLISSGLGYLSLDVLIGSAIVLSGVWLISASTLRRPYLEVFRRALSSGSLDSNTGPDELDISSAEVLVERLASRDPLEVTAAMSILSQRGRERLIPALVLYHQDERVLVRALSIFGASSLTHWIPLAEPLLRHPKEAVRIAAVRALSSHERPHIWEQMLEDTSSRVQGYAVLHLALRDGEFPLIEHPRVSVLLKQPGEFGTAERLGMLAAIADAAPDPELATLLLELSKSEGLRVSAEGTELIARAAVRQRDLRLINTLIEFLGGHVGREAARAALGEFGEPAFIRLAAKLVDPSCERRLRIHLPRTLARFGTQRAADLLLSQLENEADGLVRYKSLRGLGRLVLRRGVRVNPERIERIIENNLHEYFRLLGLEEALSTATSSIAGNGRQPLAAGRLLRGLLEDKLDQSLDRVFRLLKIMHPEEDVHGIYLATRSDDPRVRANASEFLDTLLLNGAKESSRRLLRLVTDELDPAERMRRAVVALVNPPPSSRDEALLALLEDNDLTLASLAAAHAAALGGDALDRAVSHARSERPMLAEMARVFQLRGAVG